MLLREEKRREEKRREEKRNLCPGEGAANGKGL